MSAFDREVAARNAWMEARGEGYEGLVAVAWSMVNRAKLGKLWFEAHGAPHPLFGSGHLAEAVLDPYQYSGWNLDKGDSALRRAMCLLEDDDPLLESCRKAVDQALAGGVDPTGGATHYYNPDVVPTPAWVPGATFTVKIGHHKFFRDVR